MYQQNAEMEVTTFLQGYLVNSKYKSTVVVR